MKLANPSINLNRTLDNSMTYLSYANTKVVNKDDSYISTTSENSHLKDINRFNLTVYLIASEDITANGHVYPFVDVVEMSRRTIR